MYDGDNMNFDNLFKVIGSKGLTLKKVSQETELSSGILSEWKNGNRVPSITKLKNVAEYLGCSLDYIIGRTEVSETPTMMLNVYFDDYTYSKSFFAQYPLSCVWNR